MSSSKALAALFFLSLTVSGITSRANEPAFCDLANFQKTEINVAAKGLVKTHAYQLGDLVLVGLAVGKSDISATQALANQFSQFTPAEKSCTWYFNDDNATAEKVFNHRYVSNPSFKGPKIADEYERVLGSTFADEATSFMSCAVDHGYIAMGCQGMKHRGPSVFAMLLAYAGCSPKSATAIANKVWGTNFVEVETREAIANKGKILGDLNPALRNQLQVLMGAKSL